MSILEEVRWLFEDLRGILEEFSLLLEESSNILDFRDFIRTNKIILADLRIY